MNISTELLDGLISSLKKTRISDRIKKTGNRSQYYIDEFIKPSSDSREHSNKKIEIAERLKKEGKDVLVEKDIIVNGIRIRPDVHYFQNNVLNIIEVEYGCRRNNKTFKNFKQIRANITEVRWKKGIWKESIIRKVYEGVVNQTHYPRKYTPTFFYYLMELFKETIDKENPIKPPKNFLTSLKRKRIEIG